MKFSIRSKLIVVISLLMIVMFSITGYILVDRKTKELTKDIYTNALNFAKLTSSNIVTLYRTYYVQGGFVYFNREMTTVFSLNSDISSLSLLSYEGEILYDSSQEKKSQYKGKKRLIESDVLLNQIHDIKPSLVTTEGRTLYVLSQKDGSYVYVDKNEKTIQPLKDTERIASIIYPVDEVHRLMYVVSYVNLDNRIREMIMSVFLLLVASSVAGIFVASYFSSKIVRPIKSLTQEAIEIGKGNFDTHVYIKTRDELKLLGDTFNNMTRELKKSTHMLIEKERIEKELEIAREIQAQFFPKEKIMKGLDVAAGIVPALEIGGDSVDFITLDEDRSLTYVGDVTGHGVSSGLIVSMANALIYSYSTLHQSPRDILIGTNRVLYAKTSRDMFITMLMALWDAKNNTLTYTQAGHDPLFYYDASENNLVKGVKGGVALGIVPDISNSIKENKIKMASDDVVVIYSDGFPESFRHGLDGKREIMGFKRFQQIIAYAVHFPSANEIYDSIVKQTEEFVQNYPQFDDMTLVVLRKT